MLAVCRMPFFRLMACARTVAATTTTRVGHFSSVRKHVVDVSEVTNRLGVRLTQEELQRLRQKLDTNKDGVVTRAEVSRTSQTAMEDRSIRELCLSVIEQPHSWMDQLVSRHALRVCDVAGTLLYAVSGTQVAGDAGMNIIGCTLVGCITALGGGTLNNILFGASSPLHSSPGVFWVRSPSYLAMAMGASIVTFYLWPYYCQLQADSYIKNMKRSERNPDNSISQAAFVRECEENEIFFNSIKATLGRRGQGKTAVQVFSLLDDDKSGSLDDHEIRKLAQKNFDNSDKTYLFDSLALASFAVAAAHGGINAGTHPLVAASSGVTICFGGILRDVLCDRPVAIGAQSYAFCTGTGAAVYVALRELCVRGLPTSIFTRIILASGCTLALRYWEYERGSPFLAPMHGRVTEK